MVCCVFCSRIGIGDLLILSEAEEYLIFLHRRPKSQDKMNIRTKKEWHFLAGNHLFTVNIPTSSSYNEHQFTTCLFPVPTSNHTYLRKITSLIQQNNLKAPQATQLPFSSRHGHLKGLSSELKELSQTYYSGIGHFCEYDPCLSTRLPHTI